MFVELNLRGRIFLIGTILVALIAVLIRLPPILLLATLMVSYLISYPLSMRRLEPPEVIITGKLRHGVMYRGEPDLLKIEVENLSNDVIPLVHLKLNIPNSIFMINRPLDYWFTLEPVEKLQFNLPILPLVRGYYEIGPIIVSLSDPFQIFEHELDTIDKIPARIYPKRLGPTVSKSRAKRVFNKLVGYFSTTLRGMGTDFHSLRDYVRGDPSKIVDWNATARANKLISKEFEEEKKLEVIIALAAGSTMRGSKFDFMLGAALDIYQGFLNENKPVGFVYFDNEILMDYKPSSSKSQLNKVWASIYGVIPRDVYADYNVLDRWINKEGITGSLVIILGDLEGDFKEIGDATRNIRLRGNYTIFLDVWGYSFTYEQEVEDVAVDIGADKYGTILSQIIGRGIKQYNIFRALDVKSEFNRYGVIYGYLEGPEDNIINSLDRAMYSYLGDQWKAVA